MPLSHKWDMPTWQMDGTLGTLKLTWQIKIILKKFISHLKNAILAFKLKNKQKLNS